MITVKQLIEKLQRFHPGAPVVTEDENADRKAIGLIVLDDDEVVIRIESRDHERRMFGDPPSEYES
ncbi:MAG: hypothetical protein V7K94_09995 [Nostoc sp.]|uniref:hypothetical protein n=1 Tax=Nostoc sp. TaxID=1180 RepID=UPI002FFA63B5